MVHFLNKQIKYFMWNSKPQIWVQLTFTIFSHCSSITYISLCPQRNWFASCPPLPYELLGTSPASVDQFLWIHRISILVFPKNYLMDWLHGIMWWTLKIFKCPIPTPQKVRLGRSKVKFRNQYLVAFICFSDIFLSKPNLSISFFILFYLVF